MAQFRNEILAGEELVRDAIRSSDYVEGESGWRIATDGSAEFTDLLLRSLSGGSRIVVVQNGRVRIINTLTDEIDAEMTPGGGSENDPGFIAYDRDPFVPTYYAMLGPGYVELGASDESWAASPRIGVSRAAGPADPITLFFQSGYMSTGAQVEVDMKSVAAGGTPSLSVTGSDGDVDMDVQGSLSVRDTDITVTPVTVTGDGGATWTSAECHHYALGKLHWVCIYMDSSGAGSGTSNVQFSLPFVPDRTVRQMLPVYGSTGSTLITGSAVVFAGGSGAVFDRIRTNTGSGSVGSIIGSDISSNDFFSIQGWMREE